MVLVKEFEGMNMNAADNIEIDDTDIPLLVDANDNQQQSALGNDARQLPSLFQDVEQPKIPITLLCGYLGSGKSTLLNYILNENHGLKIAVILNEFGDSLEIEKAVTLASPGNEDLSDVLALPNGCLCCNIKSSAVMAIEKLVETAGGRFNYILLEATGLADPANVANMFWLDDGLGSRIMLDGMVTVVDAKFIMKNLVDNSTMVLEDSSTKFKPTTAHLQLLHADVIVLNKIDLVDKKELENVEKEIKSINPLAPIIRTTYCKLDKLESILNLHTYEQVDNILQNAEKTAMFSQNHDHHDHRISTMAIQIPPLNYSSKPVLDEWLRSLLWENELLFTSNPAVKIDAEIQRTKGILIFKDAQPEIIQGVRMMYEFKITQYKGDSSMGKLVLIGINIKENEQLIKDSLASQLGNL